MISFQCKIVRLVIVLIFSFFISSAVASDAFPKEGSQLYQSYCVLCHGVDGKGDGRMSKVVKAPPPTDLTVSSANLEYIELIVVNGGEKLGRSYQMPPWGDQFNESQVKAITQYVHSLQSSD